MPGETGVTVVTMLVCLFYFACEAAGASSARHSLRPLIFRRRDVPGKPRADRAARSRNYVCERGCLKFESVRPSLRGAQATKQSTIRHSGAMRSIEPGISRFPDVQL